MRAILTYHSIDDSGSPISVAPATFERQVGWLASGRVRVMRLPDLVRAPDTEDAVALTFDDGFDNFRTEAWPRLWAHGLPATVYVVSGHAGATNAWGGRSAHGIPTLPLLGWRELAALAGQGLDVGAHTRTHARLSRITDTQAEDEIVGCREDIHARLGLRAVSFAYPYGDAPTVARRLARRSFESACTTEHHTLDESDAVEALPRLDMYYFQGRDALAAWGRPSFRARVATRRAARAVRRILLGMAGTR